MTRPPIHAVYITVPSHLGIVLRWEAPGWRVRRDERPVGLPVISLN